jgi:5-methylcytosine-specific restriction endonuclease McrA
VVLQDATLVLNRHWTPVDFTTVLDALCKLYTGGARAVKPDDYTLHDFDSWTSVKVAAHTPRVRTATLSIPVPEIIVLARFGKLPKRGVAFSRSNIYKRDRFTCQYCGKKPGVAELTIDHVVPRARGGISSWTNCVVACVRCNFSKASQTLAEAGLRLRVQPVKPSFMPRLVLARVPCKASWEKFISDAYWSTELKK